MVARMAGFPIESLTLLFEKDYEVSCNWKTFHDNGLCDYHVSIAHQTTLKDVQGHTKYYQYMFDDYVNALITPITQKWKSENEPWEVLPEPMRSQFITFGIFPNLHIYALPDGTLYVERIDPISVSECQIHSEVYGRPHHLNHIGELEKWYEALFEEDRILSRRCPKKVMPAFRAKVESQNIHLGQSIPWKPVLCSSSNSFVAFCYPDFSES